MCPEIGQVDLKIITGLSDRTNTQIKPHIFRDEDIKKPLWNYVASGGKKASERLRKFVDITLIL